MAAHDTKPGTGTTPPDDPEPQSTINDALTPANGVTDAYAREYCLYCGSDDDLYEVLVTIDERTSEYALRCGLCNGTWAP